MQIQALDRTQPGLPMKKGRAGMMTHDYIRHGATTLFAALNALDGTAIDQRMARHRHQELILFLSNWSYSRLSLRSCCPSMRPPNRLLALMKSHMQWNGTSNGGTAACPTQFQPARRISADLHRRPSLCHETNFGRSLSTGITRGFFAAHSRCTTETIAHCSCVTP